MTGTPNVEPAEHHRLPGYLARSPLRGKAWQWGGVAAILHALLGLGLAGLEARLKNHWSLAAAFLRLDTTGIVVSSAVVGGLVWLLAFLVQRQLAEDARLRERLYEIIDGLPDPAAVRDLNGRYVMWNQAAVRYYGLPREQVVGRQPRDLFPPAIAAQFAETDKRARQGTTPVETRITMPPLYGKPRRMTVLRVAPIRSLDAMQRLRGVVSILTDVTAAQEQAESARREEVLLGLALEASGAAAWDWNLVDDKVSYSDSFQRLLRYAGSDFARDFRFRDRLHPDDREATLAAVQASLKQRVNFDCQYRLECFDGVYRRFAARGVSLVDAWGQGHFAGLLIPIDSGAAPSRAAPPPGRR